MKKSLSVFFSPAHAYEKETIYKAKFPSYKEYVIERVFQNTEPTARDLRGPRLLEIIRIADGEHPYFGE